MDGICNEISNHLLNKGSFPCISNDMLLGLKLDHILGFQLGCVILAQSRNAFTIINLVFVKNSNRRINSVFHELTFDDDAQEPAMQAIQSQNPPSPNHPVETTQR